MYKLLSFIFICSFLTTFANTDNFSIYKKLNIADNNITLSKPISKSTLMTNDSILKTYNELKLKSKMDYTVFYNAIIGLKKISNIKNDIITIVDFSKSSVKERFFVIDLKKKKVLYSTYVMHGKNSGGAIPTSFSNILDSNKSSPGFYKTDITYNGSNGYSLRLDGLEKGINDRARERAIVIHGSDYAIPSKGATMLSKSLGCPAIPREISKEVINIIKDGRLLYIHTNSQDYLSKTTILT